MRKVPASIVVILALSSCGRSGEADSDETVIEKQVRRTPRQLNDPRTPAQQSRPNPAPMLAPAAATATAEELPEPPLEPEPDRPVPPDDYGLIQPSDGMPEAVALTHHALAGYEVVAVFDNPDSASAKLGYLRLGARTKVTSSVEGKGCSKRWYQLPQGGYACSGRGLVVQKGSAPFMKYPPAPPRLDQAFPYDYGFVKSWNTAFWWRVPTVDERSLASKKRKSLEAKREGKPLPEHVPTPAPAAAEAKPKVAEAKPTAAAEAKPTTAAEAKPTAAAEAKPKTDKKRADASGLKALPGPDGNAVLANAANVPAEKPAETPPIAAPAPAPATAPARGPAPVAAKETPPPAPAAMPPAEPEIPLPLHSETPWLERGFFVSLGEKFAVDGKSWWRTSRGAYVRADAVYKYNVKDFEGAVLEEGVDFPFGYVMSSKGSKLLELADDGKLKVVETIPHRTFVDLSDETVIGGKTYMMTTDGQFIKKGHIRMAQPQPMPEGLEPWERWVDVSLSKQMLIAYEGTRPVFVTLVSTGKKGTKEEPFDTPTGRWRIQSKRVSSTMDGAPEDGTFSIEDVPWTMYFEGNYALHGAFWHEGFGRVRSHGCVNLGASDARWLFFWTTPFLPEGWHGVQAHDGSPGSTVVVHT